MIFRSDIFRYILLLLALLLINPVFSQLNLDSLQNIAADQHKHDTIRLGAAALLIDNLPQGKESDRYIDMMGEIAQKNLQKKNLHPKLKRSYNLYLAAYYNNISIRFEDRNDPRSMNYLNKAIKIYESLGAKDEFYIALVSKGVLLARRKQYKEAISSYYKALKFFELDEDANRDGISYVHANLGVVYEEQGQLEIAIAHLKKAVRNIDLKPGTPSAEDELQKFTMYFNIGGAYINLGKPDEARKNLEKSLYFSRKHGQNSFSSYALCKLGLIDLNEMRLEEAEMKLTEANQLAESEHSKASALVYLGDVYLRKKEYQKARDLLEKGLALAQSLHELDLQETATKLLYQAYKQSGASSEALLMLEKYHQIKDSIDIDANKNELLAQKLKYDYEKKALRSKLESERVTSGKNIQLTILSLGLILILTGTLFIYRNAKNKQILSRYEKNDLKQKLLVSQMNPHFIFNSLNAIQNCIYKQDALNAGTYLSQFAELMRMILELSRKDKITLETEIKLLENYLHLQQFRFNNKFDYTIEIDPVLDPAQVEIPPMLAQPFIENAIEHGIFHLKDKGKIQIRILKKGENLRLEIEDNGVGLSKSPKKAKSHNSLATVITQERINELFFNKKGKHEIEIHDLALENEGQSGVKVVLEVPLK